jgi:hypothetical protein
MAVDVDDRVLGARHRVHGHDQRRLRLVFPNVRNRQVRRPVSARAVLDGALALTSLRNLGDARRAANEDGCHEDSSFTGHWGIVLRGQRNVLSGSGREPAGG